MVFERNLSSRIEKVKPTERMRSLVLAPDESRFYTSATDSLCAFGAHDGRPLWSYTPRRSFGFLVISPTRVAVSRDGLVAAGFDDGALGVWSPEGRCIARWADNDGPGMLGFSTDGQFIVGTDGFSVCAWDLANWSKVIKFWLHEKAFGFAVHPQANLAAVRTLDFVSIHEIATGSVQSAFEVKSGLPLVAFRPYSMQIAVADAYKVMVVEPSGKVAARVDSEGIRVTSLAWSGDGSRLAIGTFDGSISISEC
jgi:WD40 repeat protein